MEEGEVKGSKRAAHRRRAYAQTGSRVDPEPGKGRIFRAIIGFRPAAIMRLRAYAESR